MSGENTDKKPRAAQMLSYGGAQFASSIYMAFSSYYILMFLTDVVLIPPAATAVVMFCYRVLGTLDIQPIGLFINRKHFKDGKYRPYYKWCALPFTISLAVLGLAPGVASSYRAIYLVIVLVICDLSWSVLHTASISMLPYLAQEDISRTKFMSFSHGSSIIAYIIVGTFMLPLANILGGGDRGEGIALTLALLAVIAAVLLFNAYFRLKERFYVEIKDKPSIKDIYLAMARNRRFLLFLLGTCLYYMADSFKNMTTYHYVAHVLGRADLLPVLILAGLISPLLMQPVIPQLLKYAKKEGLIIFGVFAASCSCILMLAVDKPITLAVCIVLYGIFTSITANLVYTVMASFTDEMRVEQNINMSEMLASSMDFISNIGISVASGISAAALAAVGYSAQAQSQTATALMGIRALYILCTAAGMILSGIALLMFRKKSKSRSRNNY